MLAHLKRMIYDIKRKEINAFAGDEATQGILSKSKAFTFFSSER